MSRISKGKVPKNSRVFFLFFFFQKSIYVLKPPLNPVWIFAGTAQLKQALIGV